MAVRVKTKVKSEFVVPLLETEADESELAPLANNVGIDTLTQTQPIQNDQNASEEQEQDSWYQLSINIDLSDLEKLAEKGEKFLNKVDKLVGVFTVVLKIMRLFQSDLKSLSKLLKIVIKQLVKQLNKFIESLISTGIYVTPIIPDFDKRQPGYILPINGGFSEFKARFTASCLNTNDPTAPKFGPQDSVGGMVIAAGAGTNDPSLIANMLKNLDILSKFFGFRNPMPPPPVNVMAKAGYFKSDSGQKRMGVEVSWEHPGDTVSITGFKLYRCKNAAGLKKIFIENNKQVQRFAYSDEDFNSGDPYEVQYFPLKFRYKYIDFEVEPGQEYNYQIFSTSGFDFIDKYAFLQSVESPLGSQRVKATPKSCIPLSELKWYRIFDVDGNPVDKSKMAGKWAPLTVKEILPTEFNNIFMLLDNFSDALSGQVSSAGDAMSKYISFLSKKVKKLLEITTEIKNLVQRILQYQLQGDVLLLELPPEVGGMQRFTERFNTAVIDEGYVFGVLGDPEEEETGEFPDTSLDSLEGLFVGVGLVYGFPDFSSDFSQRFVTEEQQAQYKKQLERFKKSFEVYRKLLGMEE